MPFVQRYSDVKKGAIIFAGNTLGLSKAANSNSPGTEGSIGAFTSLNTSLQVGNFPAGTTLDYTLNGSRAQLSLPAGSSVLYAELVWGGLYRSTVNNISNLINNPVVFSTPLSANVQIAPDAATSQDFVITVDNVTVGFYVRSANVTSLVAAALSGAYSVQRVPALIEAIDSRTSQTNHAGWTLAVVYENQTLDLRNLTLWSGGNVVSPSTGSTTVTVTNFLTPGVLPITGKVFVSAQEGDAVLTGDRMLFGQTVATLGTLSGPNNPAGNFFASQINDQNGLLDTTGTFGTRNANAAAGTNTVACRQGWDTTAVDVSATLAPAQTSAVIRFTSDGDLYVPNALGLQIDSKGADLAVLKTADKTFASVGDEITYSVKIANSGEVSALNVAVNDFLPPETSLVDGSVFLDGSPYAGGLPVSIAEIAAGGSSEVVFTVKVNSLPAQNPMLNTARADYQFFPFAGYQASGFADSNQTSVAIIRENTQALKSVDKNFAVAGDVLNYTAQITNAGSVPMVNLFFKDPIPDGTAFVDGSVLINGISFPTYNPENGFFAVNLTPQESATILFQVRVNQGDNSEMIIPNQFNVTFDYVLPDGSTLAASVDSNIVTTEILTYSIPKVKSSDKTFLQEGETARQTVTITNNSQAALYNLFFKDTLSQGASYVAGSVAVNGVSQPSYDLVAGFPLPDLAVGQAVAVSYTIRANDPMTVSPVTNFATLAYTVNDPARGPVNFSEDTNTISLPVVSNRITVVKSVDKTVAAKGDNLHYTSVITNTGTLNKINLVFTDQIPLGTTFVAGSVRINGVSYPAYNPQNGFALPDIAPGAAVNVEFDVTVN